MVAEHVAEESVNRMLEDGLIAPMILKLYISKNLNDMILKAFELNSKKRFQSAEEFCDALGGNME